MRIVQVNAHPEGSGGGPERYCFGLSRRLASRGHEVCVLTSRMHSASNPTQADALDGLEVREHRCLSTVWGNPVTLVPEIFRERADVIHAHSYIFATTNQSALAQRLRNDASLLIHLHGGLDVCGSPDIRIMKISAKRHLYDPTVGGWTLRSATALASVSKRDMQLARQIFSLDHNSLYWLPNAVDTDMFRPADGDSGLRVSYVGRLEACKGFHTFLEIASGVAEAVGDATFTVLGGGSMEGLLNKARSELGPRLQAMGRVPPQEVARTLSQCDVLVLPSLTEGVPTVCLEALASGVPVVASDIGGTSEVIINDVTGYLVPPGRPTPFVSKVLRILDNPALGRKLGRNGRRMIIDKYAWPKAVDNAERLYESIRS